MDKAAAGQESNPCPAAAFLRQEQPFPYFNNP